MRIRRGRFAGAILFAVLMAGLVAPWLGYDVGTSAQVDRAGLGPSLAHPLGTDHLGRDVAWRLLLSCEAMVLPALGAAGVALLTGVLSGAWAGLRGGSAATLVRYLYTVVQALPRFVAVLLAAAIYGPDPTVLAVATGFTYAPVLGAAVHSRLEELRRAEFVLGLRAHGVPPWRIVLVHLLWSACRRLIARHLLQVVAYLVVLETTLAYIGSFGVQEPTPSWGNMIVFEWGRGNPVAAWSPIVALWIVLIACHQAAAALRGESHAA